MEYRTFKDSDCKISLLGFGAMRLPKLDQQREEIDWEKAEELVDYALNHGINYFDTAHMYHGGESERFLGSVLNKYDRKRFKLVTKLPIWMAETPKDMEKIFDLQLKHLQTDYFDFYLLHCLNKENFAKCQEFGAYEFLLKKQAAGNIGRIGFSFHDSPEVLEEIVKTYPWDFAQLQLNYLDWELLRAKEQYEILERNKIPCIVMEPVRGGALADPGSEAESFFEAARPGSSSAAWALRFAASLPNVLTVLSGMSTLEQLQENLETFSPLEPLTEADNEVIDRAREAIKRRDQIPCTGCRYCADCPVGVDIPKIFKLYNNDYAVVKDKETFRKAYGALLIGEQAHNCIACGSCSSVCPQKIDIPEQMKRISGLIKEQ